MWSNTPNFIETPRAEPAVAASGPSWPATIACRHQIRDGHGRNKSGHGGVSHHCGALAPLDLLDLVGLRAARRHHLDARALGLADERARERRGDGDLAFLGVGLRLAD